MPCGMHKAGSDTALQKQAVINFLWPMAKQMLISSIPGVGPFVYPALGAAQTVGSALHGDVGAAGQGLLHSGVNLFQLARGANRERTPEELKYGWSGLRKLYEASGNDPRFLANEFQRAGAGRVLKGATGALQHWGHTKAKDIVEGAESAISKVSPTAGKWFGEAGRWTAENPIKTMVGLTVAPMAAQYAWSKLTDKDKEKRTSGTPIEVHDRMSQPVTNISNVAPGIGYGN